MTLPLYAQWRLSGENLPERLIEAHEESAPSFHLPGSDALGDFADLLGLAPDAHEDAPAAQSEEESDSAAMPSAPFPLPALIPEDVPGEVVLTREIDFGACTGRRAHLLFDMLAGSGRVVLEPAPARFPRPGMPQGDAPTLLAAFDRGPLTLDVTQAMFSRRRYWLKLHFDAARPAGVCGAVLLRVSGAAMLKNTFIHPDPALRLLTVKTDVLSTRNGEFTLTAQLCPGNAGAASPIRERMLTLKAQENTSVTLTMEADCPCFAPGKPYAAPGMKIQLFEKDSRVPCDSVTLLCGFPGDASGSYLPLSPGDCRRPPEALLQALTAMHVQSVSLSTPGTDLLYRLLTRAGVAVRQMNASPEDAQCLRRYPCVTLDPGVSPRDEAEDPILSAWRLCGLTTYPRALDPAMTQADMLREITGRAIDPDEYADVLAWLRAVSIRLRAEAIRRGALSGAYCALEEWKNEDVAQAIASALAPVHLSALPLSGAWWTLSRFSASLHAYIPEGAFPPGTPLRAQAVLEDAQGGVLADIDLLCPPGGGPLGLLEAQLPENTCVLEMTTRLYAGDAIVEESVLPVYVGERGPLEAAFAN